MAEHMVFWYSKTDVIDSRTELRTEKMEHIARDEAFALLKKIHKDPFHIQHALTVEAVMKWYAKRAGLWR